MNRDVEGKDCSISRKTFIYTQKRSNTHKRHNQQLIFDDQTQFSKPNDPNLIRLIGNICQEQNRRVGRSMRANKERVLANPALDGL